MSRVGVAERLLTGIVMVFLASTCLSIAAAQIALAVAGLLWLAVPRLRRGLPRRLLWPFALFALLSLTAALGSDAPASSLTDIRDLSLFAVMLVVPAAASLEPAGRLRLALLAGASIAAVWGLISYAATPGGLLFRSSGPMGHYMTFGGLLMLVLVAQTAELLTRRWRELAQAELLGRVLPLPLLLAGLGVSYARSAWVGLLCGVLVLLLVTHPRRLWLLPLALLISLPLLPDSIQQRLGSVLSYRHDTSSTERLQMARSGLAMVADHPLLGVGPGRVPARYPSYRLPEAPDRVPSHLHSNVIQLAAERGVPALLAWLWLLFETGLQAWRRWRAGAGRASALGALGALAAMLGAGLFEYNFGDSEVLMLFLALISLPWAERGDPAVEHQRP